MSKENQVECENCNAQLPFCCCGNTRTLEAENGPICPYCGYLNKASDSDGILYNESTTETECGQCSKEFRVRLYISHMWTAKRK